MGATIANRQTFRRLVEFNGANPGEVEDCLQSLGHEGIEYFVSRDKGVLSKNPEERDEKPIFVHERDLGRTGRISDRAAVFRRYQEPIHLTRIYVEGRDLKQARALIRSRIQR